MELFKIRIRHREQTTWTSKRRVGNANELLGGDEAGHDPSMHYTFTAHYMVLNGRHSFYY